MKRKFCYALLFGGLWLLISCIFAVWWAGAISGFLPIGYVWWVIIGIALLPGFLMSSMFFSNLLHQRLKKYPNTNEDTTVIVCAYNEEATIEKTIDCICKQAYLGHIQLLVVDNGSNDSTKSKIIKAAHGLKNTNCSIEYVYCETLGKTNALNCALNLVGTRHFITIDADTFLAKNAVQRIMNHIVAKKSACVAGNLFVHNAKASIFTRMQNYDYLLSIAAIKRFQGSYQSTLVAQGAFSAYQTKAVRL